MWFTICPASISLASAFLSPAERPVRSTSRGAGANRAAIWLSSSALGKEVSAEAGAGVFWAVAIIVDTSKNVRSRRMGVEVLGEKDNVPENDMLEGMTAKQEARSLLEKLPDNCSIEDIQYHLYVLEKVRSGLEDARENGTISQEEA